MVDYMLTTVDNPYNPFTQFNDWLGFDTYKGYNTCEYLARVVVTSDDLSEEDQRYDIDRAVASILDSNVLGLYRIVDKDFNAVILIESDMGYDTQVVVTST